MPYSNRRNWCHAVLFLGLVLLACLAVVAFAAVIDKVIYSFLAETLTADFVL